MRGDLFSDQVKISKAVQFQLFSGQALIYSGVSMLRTKGIVLSSKADGVQTGRRSSVKAAVSVYAVKDSVT